MGRTIEIVAGEEKSEVFTVVDANGAAVDLTGAFCYFGVFRKSTNTQIFQLDNDPAQSNTGLVITTPLSGIVTVTFANADTVGEATTGDDVVGEYQFWVRLDPAGTDDPQTTQEGKFVIKPSFVTFS